MNFLAKRFVAGTTADEALDAVHRLNETHLKATLDFLGEETRSEAQAAASTEEYVRLLDWIAAAGLDCNVSVKLTQLGLAIQDELARKNLRRILETASRHGNFVRIDMEGSAYTQSTLDLFYPLFAEFKDTGVVIQAALRRSAADIQKLNRAKARVRLCKGAYKEPDAIAFQGRAAVDKSYDELARELIAQGTYPAFATHDDARIGWVLRACEERRMPKESFEFQMLYGIRRPFWRQLSERGYTVRIYVPYGTHWFPYYYRRIRERKENLLFALRSIFSD